MKKVLFDTNLFIEWINHGRRQELFEAPGYVRYLSAVVAMELRAGAARTASRRAIDALVKANASAGRLLAPSAASFDLAGAVLRRLRLAGAEVRQASLVNDVLIALSARQIGATVVTLNDRDFRAIGDVVDFSHEPVS